MIITYTHKNTHLWRNFRRFFLILFMVFMNGFYAFGFYSVAQAAEKNREQIIIVGSSTVYPFAKAVSNAYVERYHKPAPKISNGGSGGGFKAFCAGLGLKFPDISNASRPMKLKEWKLCQKNGVSDITEVRFGNDGVGLVTSPLNNNINNLSIMHIYKAIAEYVPKDGVMIRNPYRMWSDIDPSLPNQIIQIYGPNNTHGSYSIIVKAIVKRTCQKNLFYFRELKKTAKNQEVYKSQLKRYCSKLRTDGLFLATSPTLKRILQTLKENKQALFFEAYGAIFSNRDKLKAISINGVEPRIYTISDKSYPLYRPIFFYIKNAHRDIVPNMHFYLKEFMGDHAVGTFGYLTAIGLAGLSITDLKKTRYSVAIGRKMTRFSNHNYHRTLPFHKKLRK